MDNDEIARHIRAAQPDIVFVSFGCPKAEKWMATNYQRLGVPVMIGVGATIDFLAGRVKRAPRWMQRSGTEWLYRLAQEPRRLYRRYARDFAHLGIATLGQLWHCHRRTSSVAAIYHRRPASIVLDDPNWLRLHLAPRLDRAAVERDETIWDQVQGHDCIAHMQRVQCIDSTGLALLARLHRRLRAEGNHLVLVAPTRRVRKALRWARLDQVFLIAENLEQARALIQQAREQQSHNVIESETDWTLPLTWQGEITAENADVVWQKTHEYISMVSTRKKQIAIDASRVRFMDSAGLRTMLTAKRHADSLTTNLVFTGLNRELRKLAAISGIHHL
jgi:N-acetylglucosaminyldiphosphoundecaprenol N-acetyl-beta-D-mannosaminyltransferase